MSISNRRFREGSFYTGGGGGLLGSILLDWEPVFYVEREKYCQRVIRARADDGFIPRGPIFTDVHLFAHHAGEFRGLVDIATGGVPCQPFSVAGRRKSEADDRNLWPITQECLRLVGCGLGYFENVSNLVSLPYWRRVLGAFSEGGFDAGWRILSAAEVGAPHKRDRLWLVVHSQQCRCGGQSRRGAGSEFADGYKELERKHSFGNSDGFIQEEIQSVSQGRWMEEVAESSGIRGGESGILEDRGIGKKERGIGIGEIKKEFFPTPRSCDGDKMNQVYGNGRLTLTGAVKRFPTPTNSMATVADMEQARYAGNGGKRPSYQEAKFPTPNASNSTGVGEHGDGGMNLQTFIQKTEKAEGSLNPDWVEWLMGWPIGWTSLEPLPRERFEEWYHRTLYGTWWDDEQGIPRVARKVPNRVARLKAIGNGQVPLCMATAWKLLTQFEND